MSTRPKGAPGVLAGTHRAQETNDDLRFYSLAHLMSLGPQAGISGMYALGIRIDAEKLKACYLAQNFTFEIVGGRVTVRRDKFKKSFKDLETAAVAIGVLKECMVLPWSTP